MRQPQAKRQPPPASPPASCTVMQRPGCQLGPASSSASPTAMQRPGRQLRPASPPASRTAMQRPECQLRRMRLADLPSVMDLERQAYPYPWRKGMFSDCLQQGDECWLLAHGGRLIGHSVLALGAGESHLLNLCVHPASQGQGFGRVLAEHTVAQAKARFATVVFLEVRPSNRAAQRLYQTLGFAQIGVRPNYYPAPQGREDALVLAKPLGAAQPIAV